MEELDVSEYARESIVGCNMDVQWMFMLYNATWCAIWIHLDPFGLVLEQVKSFEIGATASPQDVNELAKYGISLSAVHDAFRWLCTVNTQSLPRAITPNTIADVVGCHLLMARFVFVFLLSTLHPIVIQHISGGSIFVYQRKFSCRTPKWPTFILFSCHLLCHTERWIWGWLINTSEDDKEPEHWANVAPVDLPHSSQMVVVHQCGNSGMSRSLLTIIVSLVLLFASNDAWAHRHFRKN